MNEKQKTVPILTAMKRYVEDGAVGFHTPGHKQGKGMDAEFLI